MSSTAWACAAAKLAKHRAARSSAKFLFRMVKSIIFAAALYFKMPFVFKSASMPLCALSDRLCL